MLPSRFRLPLCEEAKNFCSEVWGKYHSLIHNNCSCDHKHCHDPLFNPLYTFCNICIYCINIWVGSPLLSISVLYSPLSLSACYSPQTEVRVTYQVVPLIFFVIHKIYTTSPCWRHVIFLPAFSCHYTWVITQRVWTCPRLFIGLDVWGEKNTHTLLWMISHLE